MSLFPDPVDLALDLVRLDSANPPGREAECAGLVGGMLEAAGFTVRYHEFGPGRIGLAARLRPEIDAVPLVFSGHLDTVPLGDAAWSVDPRGERRDGVLFGRGSSDMKGGVAALVVAALHAARDLPGAGGLCLVLSAAEETGCQGAQAMARDGFLPARAGALLVAEPTANRPMLGHKGAMWVAGLARGRAAHGSMPELGDNAVLKAARAVVRLARAMEVAPPAGPRPTLNVGTFHGGAKVNMVPDAASFELDVRFPVDQDHAELFESLRRIAGPEVELTVLQAAAGVATPPDHPWVVRALDILARIAGERTAPGQMAYFTDAGVLTPAMGRPPVLLLGPGDPGQAHQTDERCPEESIRQAARFYEALARDWLAGNAG